MQTLRRQRKQQFEKILLEEKIYSTSQEDRERLLSKLLDAAESRTEAQEKPAYSIGTEPLSWELYNAIKDTKYIGKATRIKMREVLENNLGKEETMRNKQWDLAHDFPPDLASIVDKLERGLGLRNMKRDDRAQEVYRWIIEQEKAGKSLKVFITWALDAERARYVGKYKNNPEAIKIDFQLAFTNQQRSSADEILI